MKNILMDFGGKYISTSEMGSINSFDFDLFLMNLHDRAYDFFESKILVEALIDKIDPNLSNIPWYIPTKYTISFVGKSDNYKNISFKRKYELAIAEGFDMVVQVNILEGDNVAHLITRNLSISSEVKDALEISVEEEFPSLVGVEVLEGERTYDDYSIDEVCNDISHFEKSIISINFKVDSSFIRKNGMKNNDGFLPFISTIFKLVTVLSELEK